ncbi:MAG: hypothetical protein HY645_00085 [Acidobacteria bacterium]|nr:hypothetical protein [Acidobacteriota bacterium]
MNKNSYRFLARFAFFMGVALSAVTELRALEDPFEGSWEVDLVKSKFASGAPVKSAISLYESLDGNRIRYTAQFVGVDGTVVTREFTAAFDGEDHAVSGDPEADAVALSRLEPRVIMGIYKKKGRVTYAFVRAVSADGKSMTARQMGTNSKGLPIYSEVLSYRLEKNPFPQKGKK